MPNICPECGSDQLLDAMRCGVCGATVVPHQEAPAKISGTDIFGYSLYVIGLVLLAMGIPCLVGLLCFFLGR